MIDRIFTAASGRAVLLSLALFLILGVSLFQFGPYPGLSERVGSLPEETVGYDGAQLRDLLEEMDAEGRGEYRLFQFLDFLNPLLLYTLVMLLTAWLLNRSTTGSASYEGRLRVLVLVPFLGFCADVVENLILLLSLRAFPASSSTASLLPVATAVKFAGLSLAALGLILSLALFLASLRRRRLRE